MLPRLLFVDIHTVRVTREMVQSYKKQKATPWCIERRRTDQADYVFPFSFSTYPESHLFSCLPRLLYS